MATRKRRRTMTRRRRRASDKSSTFRFGLFFLICSCECLRCSRQGLSGYAFRGEIGYGYTPMRCI